MLDLHSILRHAVGTTGAIRSLVDGHFEDSSHGSMIDAFEPSTGKCLYKIEVADADTVDRAVLAAKVAFKEGPWPRMQGAERAAYLFEIADLLEANSDTLALLESRDTGLPLLFTKGGHIPKAVGQIRFFAEEATRQTGQLFPMGEAYLNMVLREPLGVAAIVTPWNAPLAVSASNLAAALAVGNCCILKPSEEASLTSAVLATFCQDAGLPPGVVNVLFGPGESTGASLVSHPLIDVISFTGSTANGERIMTSAAQGFKRIGLETGGKSANIIFSDANLESALDGAVFSMFANNGEVCAAGSRIVVDDECHDEFVAKLVSRVQSMRVGSPSDIATELGPLISQRHLNWVNQCIAQSVVDGATIACGGGRPIGLDNGYYIEPTVIANVNNSMQLAQQEVFGPVAAVIRFDGSEEAAVQIANGTRFGLAAYIWTNDWSKALRVAQRIRAGFVAVNAPFVRDHRAPFGGFKESGFGRMGGNHSIALFTELKTTCLPIRPFSFPRLGAP